MTSQVFWHPPPSAFYAREGDPLKKLDLHEHRANHYLITILSPSSKNLVPKIAPKTIGYRTKCSTSVVRPICQLSRFSFSSSPNMVTSAAARWPANDLILDVAVIPDVRENQCI